MLALRSVFYALLIPGTVTVVIPAWLAAPRLGTALSNMGPLQYAGLLPMVCGAAILIRCIWDFAVVGRGTLAPIDPPTQLVVQGLYRYVRNPMYLGGLLLLLGEALVLRSGAILVWTAIWFTFINAVVIFYEEPALTRQFGASYRSYRQAVGRWIPGPTR